MSIRDINVQEFNEKHWCFIRNLTKEEQEEKTLKGSAGAYGLYQCRHCNKQQIRNKQGFKRYFFICCSECNGVRQGSNAIVLKGVNDIATTQPHLVKYLVKPEDANRYMGNSNKKIKVKCPMCDYEKEMKIDTLAGFGFGCPRCSDGLSFPEKFIRNLLEQTNITFQTQITLDNGKTKYDFYIPFLNIIIETHGIQHYKPSFERYGGRSLKEEQFNDKYKRELALKNGIKYYVVIDCRKSSLDWIKNSVVNSRLIEILDLNKDSINWQECAVKATNSLVKEVCDYFKNYGGTTAEIASIFGLGKTTVGRYLRRGDEIGWCTYNNEITQNIKKQVSSKNGKLGCKKVRRVDVNTGITMEFNSVKEASKWLVEQGKTTCKNVSPQISRCCNGKRNSAYGYRWSFVS